MKWNKREPSKSFSWHWNLPLPHTRPGSGFSGAISGDSLATGMCCLTRPAPQGAHTCPLHSPPGHWPHRWKPRFLYMVPTQDPVSILWINESMNWINMSHSLYFPSNVYFSYTYKNVLWLSPNFENKISKWRLWKVKPHLLESGLAAPGRLI